MIGVVTGVAMAVLLVALALVCLRLVLGPGLPDRIVAIDMLVVLAIAFIAVFAAGTGMTAVLDAATVLALIGFLGTVALARHLERHASPPEGE